MEESFPSGHTKTSVSTWVNLVRIPTIKQGELFEDDHQYTITSEWCVDNLATKKSQTFTKYYTLVKPMKKPIQSLLNASERILIETPPTSIERFDLSNRTRFRMFQCYKKIILLVSLLVTRGLANGKLL